MGFKRRTYRLKFDDPTLDGLEVVCRGASVEELSRFSELSALGEGLMSPENADKRRELYEFLASKIISWNLEEEAGTPIPVTADTLAAEDADLVLAIMAGWGEAVVGIPGPLARQSSAGVPSEEASLPMETLSPSPSS